MAFLVETALNYLAEAKNCGRLSHAYLISGPEGSGKEQLAAGVIRLVNGEAGENLGSLGSELVRIIGPASKSRRIGVGGKQRDKKGADGVRELEESLRLSAPSGKTKFGVIQEADRMTQEAENAFLKTLEEPPANCLLLLLTAHPQQLLPTIRSRCITVALRPAPGAGVDAPEKKLLRHALAEFAKGGEGNVSSALALGAKFSSLLKAAKAEVGKGNEEALKQEVAIYGKRTEGDWLQRREEYYKALTESVYIEKRNRLVEVLLMFYGDALRQQQGYERLDLPECADASARLARAYAAVELQRRFAAVERLRALLETNVNENLVLEVCFLKAFGPVPESAPEAVGTA